MKSDFFNYIFFIWRGNFVKFKKKIRKKQKKSKLLLLLLLIQYLIILAPTTTHRNSTTTTALMIVIVVGYIKISCRNHCKIIKWRNQSRLETTWCLKMKLLVINYCKVFEQSFLKYNDRISITHKWFLEPSIAQKQYLRKIIFRI